MKRSDVTFGQLDKALRSLGFKAQPTKRDPPGRAYTHKAGAIIAIPSYRDNERVYEHHLIAARVELENFGLADASLFAAKLQKAG